MSIRFCTLGRLRCIANLVPATLATCMMAGLQVIVMFAPVPASAIDLDEIWSRADQRGHVLLEQGRLDEAATVFQDPQWRGLSHFRSGKFAEAQQEFANVEGDSALYNLGTAAAKAGDYQTALEKLQLVVDKTPDHADAQHNLEIVRKLLDQQQQSGDSDGGDGEEQTSDESQQSDNEAQDDQGEQESDQQQDQASGESGQQQNGHQGGELSADPDDNSDTDESNQQSGDQTSEDQKADGDQQNPTEQQADAGTSSHDAEQPDTKQQRESDGAAAQQPPPEGMSEDEQATAQWLRRIPDDPSQLLRNKIRLNHMIEHADVRDMQEPW